jgi:hypothetical protein
MAVTIDQLISELEAGFIPDGPDGLAVTVEGFPELFRTLILKFDEFSVWAGGTGLMEISNGAIELARDCGKAAETAEALAMSPQVQFLRGD